MKYDIFAVGDNVADYYPAQKKIYAGGGAYNTAVIARRLGARSAYYGVFGTDENAKFLYNTLRKEKVAYPAEDIRKGRNAVSIIERKDGNSYIRAVDKGVYKGLSINDNVLKIIKNSKIVHSNIYSYFEDYLPALHYKTKISFDFSYLRNKEYIREIIPRVDMAFFSASKNNEDPEEMLNWIFDLGVEAAVLTLGDQGVLIQTEAGLTKVKALATEVIDTLGAGDAFTAAFLNELAQGNNNYQKALEEGLKTASKYCKINGGLGVAQNREKAPKIYNNIHD